MSLAVGSHSVSRRAGGSGLVGPAKTWNRGAVLPQQAVQSGRAVSAECPPAAKELMPILFALQGVLLLSSFQTGCVDLVPVCIEMCWLCF